MYRPNNPRFNASPVANRGQPYDPRPNKRTHAVNKDASKSSQSHASPALKPFGPEINKWSFAVMEENDEDKQTSSDKTSSPKRKRLNLYDPYEPVKSDSDDHLTPEQSDESLNPCGRWDIDSRQKRRVTPEPPLFRTIPQQTDSEHTEKAGYNSLGGTSDHKDLDYRPKISTAVRLSPPPTQRNYKQSRYSGPTHVPPPRPEVNKVSGRNELANPKNIINCDLCEVELSNGQELEEHLDSKSHWDTLEYIQEHNNYDDMAIAFLQDVMLYKSRKCSRAIEDTALQALQDYDHMTKVEMFHCAACNAFVPTSALAVQNHITTQGHMTNTKEFKARQRRLCLDKASTMMKELTPQFMTFAKGASPFE